MIHSIGRVARKSLLIVAAAALVLLLPVVSAQAASTADIIFVVDESGSMSGEHAWLGTMVTTLDSKLIAAGVTNNRYGLVGFGANGGGGHPVAGHKHTVGGSDFGNAAQLSTATGGLVISGGTEDGWSGINTALTGYSFRGDAAVNIILVTDEDRDNYDTTLTYAGVLASLNAKNALLNVVVAATLKAADNSTALGISSDGQNPQSLTAYKADGSGGFTKSAGGSTANTTTKAAYIDMAWATGGAAWDLSQLRYGGLTATSFTNAFVDIKVEEIEEQDPIVPLPAAGYVGLMLLAGLGAVRGIRRSRSA